MFALPRTGRLGANVPRARAKHPVLLRKSVNTFGSGIGLGHPPACTGIRLLVSLLNEMKRRSVQFGLGSLCVGGGMGLATLLELEP